MYFPCVENTLANDIKGMHSTILIDIDIFAKIHGKNLNNFLEKIHYSVLRRSDRLMRGIVLVIPNDIKVLLEKINEDKKRILFLNSGEMLNSIVFCSHILYDGRERMCEILNYEEKYLNKILDAIVTGFTGDTIVYIFVPIYDDISLYNLYVSLGFKNPFIVKTDLSGRQFDNNMIRMTRKNSVFEKNGNINDVRYLLKNKGSNVCKMKIRFSPKAIRFLKKLPDVGFELGRKGVLTQRELSGKFTLINNGSYFSANVDEDYVEIGDETRVVNMTNRYNFHTHPRGAYAIYKVKYGFPSVQDYKSFLRCVKEFDAVFHVVVSIEGVYVICISEDFVHSIDGINSDVYNFVDKNFNPQREKNDTIEKYISSINNVVYNKMHIFDVTFLNWKNITKNIDVNYTKFDMTCVSSDQSQHNYKKLFKI